MGTATATASSGSASASVDVQFTPAPPANIVLAANPVNVVAGQASTITAVVTDQYGNVVPGATVTLTANGAGTFNDSAPVTDAAGTIAVSLAVTNTPGTYSIGAASGSASASTQLTVVVGPAASLTLVANASSAVVGNPVLLTATVRDAVGNLVTDGTPVIFEVVSNTSAATVSPAGQGTVNGVAQSVLTSLADQTVTVAALAGSISNTTTVTFIPNAPTAVNFAARPGTIAAGTQSILAALVRDQYGNFIPTSVNFNAGGAGTLTVIAQNAQSGFNHIMTIGDSIPGPAGVAISLSAVNGIGYGPGVVPNATFTITDSRGTSQVTLQPGEIGGTPEALVKLNQVFPGVNQLLYTDIQFYFAALARVDAAAVGNYTVSASSGAASNSTGLSVVPGAIARVDVLPLNPSVAIDQPINFTAYAYDQFNNPVQFTPQWASGNATVGSVQATSDPHIVTFVPAHVGQAAVSATDSATATTGSSIVTVTPGTLAYIIINAPSGAVPSGTNYTFTATAYDSFNNVVTVVPAWSVDNATVGAIDAATGVFSAAYPGTAVINATQGNVSNSTAVSVVAGAPFSMLLSANPQSITAGGSSAIDATVLDWLGLPVVDGTNVSFSSSTGSVTPVVQTVGGAASATFTSTQAGNATITASSGIAANQTWVIVSPAALDHIIVSPANVTVASSSSTVFNATGYDQYNNPIALGAANWSSSNTTIGTLTDLGAGSARFDAMVAGAAVITASVGLISGTAQASVTPGTLAWIEVTPANLTVPNGATQVFQVLGHDSFNNIVFVQADWTVSGGIGGVNPVTGAQSTTFTATNAGSGSVNAFAGAFTNSSSVQVTPNAVPVVQGIVTINGVATPLANGIVLNATTVDVIAFNSTSYDPDGSISATLWVFGDGSNSTVENTTHLYSSGVHNALLRVTDDNSVSSIIPFVVNVVQALPPVAAFSANATTIYAGDSVFFDASASIDPDGGAIVSYQWDFGDLFTGAGVNATHRYLSVGNYVAVLTVTDDEGWTDSDNVSITVIAVPGNLSGTVVDAHGAPLAGANVSVDGTGYWAQSDGSGSYVVPGIPPGSYNVTASLASYYPAGASVLINTSAVTGRNFTLTVIPGTLMGAVTDSLGSPLNGANVSVEGTAYWALTNSSGAYEMTVADPGTCNVTASLAGYYPQAVGISIPANATTVQNFTLTIIPGNLSGTVRDQDGAPLAGANVSIDGTGYWTLSNGAGGYAINGIAPGAYMVTASRDWYLPQSAGATIAANATTVRNPVLTITGAFNGTVVDMDTGAPLNGTMEVWQGGSLVQSASIVNGLYWATQLLPGYYNLTANAPGYVYPLVQTNKQVLGGQNSTVNVALWGS
ncbi:MAG: carboxypeptidase regulatory-like domain-containing protein [Candidatus Micrarchaeota archaeon]|nr:carboxypeptidase regulatory-like domain-containing protein [Candidatus Micrarchaeota archaeon]